MLNSSIYQQDLKDSHSDIGLMELYDIQNVGISSILEQRYFLPMHVNQRQGMIVSSLHNLRADIATSFYNPNRLVFISPPERELGPI